MKSTCEFKDDTIKYELIESSEGIIEDYIRINIIDYYKKSFEEELIKHVYSILKIQLAHLYDVDIEEELLKIIKDCLQKYYRHIIPIRSFKNTFVRKPPDIDKIGLKIEYIRSKPQPEQKTEEWYKFRYDHITASNAYKALGTQAKYNELIVEKCKELDTKKYTGIAKTDTAFHHGIKFEELSVLYYEYLYNTKIEDFGCIEHDEYKYIAASPDGICIDKNSELYGRMLEIKNPVSREITGIPKEEYWVQMQLQMEVCNLNYCDFLETKFIEYDSKEEYDKDGLFNLSNDSKYKGQILHFMTKDNQHHYEYGPFNSTEEEFEEWSDSIMDKCSNMDWLENIYWKLEEVSCVLVLRNKEWIKSIIPKIGELWDIVLEERRTGKWIDRMPKKKVVSQKLPYKKITKGECLIINVDI